MLPQRDDPSGATELARQLRRLRGFVAGAAFEDVGDAAEQIRRLVDRLEEQGTMIDPAAYETWGVPEHIASNPVIGSRSPIAPPLEPIMFDDGRVRAEVTLGIEYQGLPACVHGGIVALIFDEMLGLANAAAATVGMTVSLQVTYVSPTPLDTPLVFEARRIRAEGRKIWSEGTLHAGDRLCASVEGMFVTPRDMVPGAETRPVEG